MWLLWSLLALIAVGLVCVAGFTWVGRQAGKAEDDAWK